MAGPEQYLQTRVMTASPYDLHMIVVSGAIRYATQAEQALEMRDVEAAHAALGKARTFVGELMAGLNPQHAPEIVDSLRALFGFAWNALIRADIDHNPQHVRDALRILDVHRETWRELAPHAQAARLQEGAEAGAAVASGKPSSVPAPHFATEKTASTRLSRVM